MAADLPCQDPREDAEQYLLPSGSPRSQALQQLLSLSYYANGEQVTSSSASLMAGP
jgi:hypothetical protein